MAQSTVIGTGAGYHFQNWLRSKVRQGRHTPSLPRDRNEVQEYQSRVRALLERAAGPRPQLDPLDPTIHQVHQRDGYRIEALSFGTFAGLRMTATAYVPEVDGPVPGVLAVHGHSLHGRRDPLEQQRCVGLAKRGYFALAVDCFGSGERSVTLPGTYHGGLDAAALWTVGLSLYGIQIYENERACDYLASRPEVDESRLAISGASGGGNQSLNSGAWDARFKAVVPVVGIGAYRKMVATGNCMCATPFALAADIEQYDLLSLMAPRALLVISAMNDGINLRYEDAQRTLGQAARIWEILDAEDKVRFEAFPTSHGYHLPMQRACTEWFDQWLMDLAPSGRSIDSDLPAEDYETVSCFPDADTPRVKTTRNLFVEMRDRKLANKQEIDNSLLADVLNVTTAVQTLHVERYQRLSDSIGYGMTLESDDGLIVPGWSVRRDYSSDADRVCILVDNTKDVVFEEPAIQVAIERGWHIWALDLPGIGEATLPYEIGGSASLRGSCEHNAARACHMLDFTLAGLWIRLLRSVATHARREGAAEIALFASRRAATPALIGAGLLDLVDRLIIKQPLASFATGDVFPALSMAAMIPNLLDLGDILDLAALRAPRQLTVVDPHDARGESLATSERTRIFRGLRDRYKELGGDGNLHVIDPHEAIQPGALWI